MIIINKVKMMVKGVLPLCLFTLLPFSASAQDFDVIRGNCLPESEVTVDGPRHAPARRLPAINTSWDANREYRQAVVLVSFSDRDFSTEKAQERYDSIFNYPGFNKGAGLGCVADYYRDQSNGLLNLKFDVYGPIKVAKATTEYGTYGSSAFSSATKKLIDSLNVDMTPYDWNNDGYVNQVIYVYAGFGGNESSTKGCIWPNTSSFAAVTAGSVIISNYTASAELWARGTLCGIGTVCHEFTHSLGLPDLYPVGNSSELSVVDEFDLMDGGNFINNGWCPCNLSAFEKMQLGWLTPVELTTATSVKNLKPVADGGDAYMIKVTDDEYLLLENRQWTGWDVRIPGHGLMIAHVDYNASAWSGNSVNSTSTHHRYDYYHADNRDYTTWRSMVTSLGLTRTNGHSPILQYTPYPYAVDLFAGDSITVGNDSLTATSVPAMTVFASDQPLNKPITNIVMNDDGTVSFDFMSLPTEIVSSIKDIKTDDDALYDLQGRRIVGTPQRGLYIQNGRKFFLK